MCDLPGSHESIRSVFPSLARPLILVPVCELGVDNKANVCIQSHNYEGVYVAVGPGGHVERHVGPDMNSKSSCCDGS